MSADAWGVKQSFLTHLLKPSSLVSVTLDGYFEPNILSMLELFEQPAVWSPMLETPHAETGQDALRRSSGDGCGRRLPASLVHGSPRRTEADVMAIERSTEDQFLTKRGCWMFLFFLSLCHQCHQCHENGENVHSTVGISGICGSYVPFVDPLPCSCCSCCPCCGAVATQFRRGGQWEGAVEWEGVQRFCHGAIRIPTNSSMEVR